LDRVATFVEVLGVLVASVIIHENAHGWVALVLGDETAKKSGRLTLNPVKHFDFVGSLILPAMLFFTTGAMFGYAKPVPVNPSKLHGKDRWGFAVVALAGPVSNVILALLASVIASQIYGIRVTNPADLQTIGGSLVPFLLSVAFTINLLLASFNLLPIPPLDGSRLLRLVLNTNGRRTLDRVEPYGFLILLGLILWLSGPLFRIFTLIESGLLRILPV
jgi:Zn-dependent protease